MVKYLRLIKLNKQVSGVTVNNFLLNHFTVTVTHIYSIYEYYYINALFIVLLCSSFINIIIMNSYCFDIGLYMVHSSI